MATRKVRTRRTTRTAVAAKPTAAKHKQAEVMLEKIRDTMISIQSASGKLKQQQDELKSLMGKCGITEIDLADIYAKLAVPTQRTLRKIDPVAFWEVTSEEDFFSAISVSVVKAGQVLSGKELDSISEKETSEVKPPELIVKMVKSKKGK